VIGVVESSQEPQESIANHRELHEILRDHIESTVLVRRRPVERVGVLARVDFDRNASVDFPVTLYFTVGEPFMVNGQHHIEVQRDGGRWKLLNPGIDDNREL